MNNLRQLSGNERLRQLSSVNAASKVNGLVRAYRRVSERQLRLQICKMLLYKKWVGGKVNTIGVFSKKAGGYYQDRYIFKGLPDLLFFKNGVMLAIETKSKGGKQSEHQKKFEQVFHNPELKRFYLLVYDWKDIEKFLDITLKL